MKPVSACSAIIVFGLVSCETMTRPINGGDFDPLRPPGSGVDLATPMAPGFSAGQFVRAAMDNTAFFSKRPKGNADASKLLSRGTSMKVISTDDSYVKVELDSGEVGYVPSIMLEDASPVLTAPPVNPDEFQVFPPLNGYGQPLPPVEPVEPPPEGEIPTVIDPDAPSAEPQSSEPVPLPPNGEESDTEGNGAAVPNLEE